MSVVFKSDTLNLYEKTDGFWLWDETRQMNLSMRAKSEREAFVEALGYYQKRLSKIEYLYNGLANKVDSFIESVQSDEDD